MKVLLQKFVKFTGEDGEELSVSHDNRGEPFREGVSLELRQGYDSRASVFLEDYEARKLRDLLNRLYPMREVEG